MNIKLRRLAYGGFALVAMSQAALGMENMNPNTMDPTTPIRKTFQTTDMSPSQNPTERIAKLPEATGTFGNFKFTAISTWYNTLTTNLVGLYTRHESYKKTIKKLEAQVAELIEVNEYHLKKINKAESEVLVLKSQIEAKDQSITSLQNDKKELLSRLGEGSRAGSYRGTASNVDSAMELSDISVNRKAKRSL